MKTDTTPHHDTQALKDAARAFADLPLEILYALACDISPGRPVNEYGELLDDQEEA